MLTAERARFGWKSEIKTDLFQTQNKTEGQRSRDHDSDYENSEIILYQAKILIEQKKHKQAVEFLEKNTEEILDVPQYHETLGDVSNCDYFFRKTWR